jgi:hypothetical protein
MCPDLVNPTWEVWRQRLLLVSQIGSGVLTLFGGFYSRIRPPDDDLRFWPLYASLVAGLAFVIWINLGEKAGKVIMWLAIFLAALLPICYFSEYQTLTVKYNGSRLICGTEYTTQASEFLRINPGVSKEDLVKSAAGKISDVWTDDSIRHARLLLGLTYSTAAGWLMLALFSGLEELKD